MERSPPPSNRACWLEGLKDQSGGAGAGGGAADEVLRGGRHLQSQLRGLLLRGLRGVQGGLCSAPANSPLQLRPQVQDTATRCIFGNACSRFPAFPHACSQGLPVMQSRGLVQGAIKGVPGAGMAGRCGAGRGPQMRHSRPPLPAAFRGELLLPPVQVPAPDPGPARLPPHTHTRSHPRRPATAQMYTTAPRKPLCQPVAGRGPAGRRSCWRRTRRSCSRRAGGTR